MKKGDNKKDHGSFFFLSSVFCGGYILYYEKKREEEKKHGPSCYTERIVGTNRNIRITSREKKDEKRDQNKDHGSLFFLSLCNLCCDFVLLKFSM
jgi:hypothetical protein